MPTFTPAKPRELKGPPSGWFRGPALGAATVRRAVLQASKVFGRKFVYTRKLSGSYLKLVLHFYQWIFWHSNRLKTLFTSCKGDDWLKKTFHAMWRRIFSAQIPPPQPCNTVFVLEYAKIFIEMYAFVLKIVTRYLNTISDLGLCVFWSDNILKTSANIWHSKRKKNTPSQKKTQCTIQPISIVKPMYMADHILTTRQIIKFNPYRPLII